MVAPIVQRDRRRSSGRRASDLQAATSARQAETMRPSSDVALAESSGSDPFARVNAPDPAPSSAEIATCQCPGFCERDHDVD